MKAEKMFSAFNAKALKGRLERMDATKQLAFGAICCERLIPNYLAFQQEVGWGDISPIQKALDCVWQYLSGKSIGHKDIESLTSDCESVAPNTETYETLYVTSAQDACFAVCCLLDFMRENDVNKIVQATTYATDSVDLYVQEIENMASNDPALEEKILTHHLMQRELAQQEENLRMIEQAPSLSREFLAHIKQT